jgi:hypothetical protein
MPLSDSSCHASPQGNPCVASHLRNPKFCFPEVSWNDVKAIRPRIREHWRLLGMRRSGRPSLGARGDPNWFNQFCLSARRCRIDQPTASTADARAGRTYYERRGSFSIPPCLLKFLILATFSLRLCTLWVILARLLRIRLLVSLCWFAITAPQTLASLPAFASESVFQFVSLA